MYVCVYNCIKNKNNLYSLQTLGWDKFIIHNILVKTSERITASLKL